MITVLNAVQKVRKNMTIKLPSWDGTPLITAVYILSLITKRRSRRM